MNFLDKSMGPEKVSTPDSKTDFAEYDVALKELETMEENAKYLSNAKPELPPGGNHQEVKGQKIFTGFNGKMGAGMFCFGRKDSGSEEYRYLTQDDFDKMVGKFREAVQNIPTETTEETPP